MKDGREFELVVQEGGNKLKEEFHLPPSLSKKTIKFIERGSSELVI